MTVGAAVASCSKAEGSNSVTLPEPDHIILGCRDLEEGIAYVEKLSGYRAAIGGAHPGRGTRNALLKLGQKAYLEILAPDPEQSELRWQKDLPTLSEPILVGWAVAVKNIEQYAVHLRDRGVQCIGPTAGSRTTPSGETLDWKTLMLEDDKKGILPFHVEWGAQSAHPSSTAPGKCVLNRWERHGELAEDAGAEGGCRPGGMEGAGEVQLHAYIGGQLGEFELRSRRWRPDRENAG